MDESTATYPVRDENGSSVYGYVLPSSYGLPPVSPEVRKAAWRWTEVIGKNVGRPLNPGLHHYYLSAAKAEELFKNGHVSREYLNELPRLGSVYGTRKKKISGL